MSLHRPVRPLLAVLIFLLCVFAGGALLAPWLYWAVQLGNSIPALQGLASQPFHRYVSRCMIAAALAGLAPFFRSLHLKSLEASGWRPAARAGRMLSFGLLLGFGSLALVALVAVASGARQWNAEHTTADFAKHIRNALLAALLVSPLEETIFRGALFGGLRRALPWIAALLVSSAIYAIVHFFERPASPSIIAWNSGFVVLMGMLRGFGNWDQVVPGFFALLLAGGILAYAYQMLGTLYFSAGLHAGWIFWLKSYAFLTVPAPQRGSSFWGTGKLLDGWFASLVLVVLFAGLICFTRWKEKKQ